MELRLALRGLGAGALGGLFAFIFARILAEPQIQSAIDYESGRDAAMATLRKAVEPEGMEVFSRGIQRNVGIGVGMILFGLAMGGLLAVAFVLVSRTLKPRMRPRALVALVAGACFLGLYLLPFLKYPANPPAIGHDETIKSRSTLYVAMMLISVVGLIGATYLWRRLRPSLGSWNATWISALALGAVLAIAMALLPPLGHLSYNQAHFGNFTTETPQPLKDAQGRIVYPGFPADVLFKFRLYSLLAQGVLWSTLAFAFGPLAERVLATEPASSFAPEGSALAS
jgi:hypothetical protein